MTPHSLIVCGYKHLIHCFQHVAMCSSEQSSVFLEGISEHVLPLMGTFHCTSTCKYKACPSESGTEVGAPLFPAVELCYFSGRWQCMSGEIWCTLDSGSVLLTETEAR